MASSDGSVEFELAEIVPDLSFCCSSCKHWNVMHINVVSIANDLGAFLPHYGLCTRIKGTDTTINVEAAFLGFPGKILMTRRDFSCSLWEAIPPPRSVSNASMDDGA